MSEKDLLEKQEEKKSSGYKTLLTSVILSSPGPLVLGIGLIFGKSSTQISDFVRRTAELLAIILSFVVYVRTNGKHSVTAEEKEEMEQRANTFVGIVMCFSGTVMIFVTLLSKTTERGNVIPALCIAFMGFVVNVVFWRRYTRLFHETKNAILGVQGRLYGAKSVVDFCVTSALFSVVFFPSSPVSYYLDRIGSVVVSLYLIYCGIKTIRDRKKPQSIV